MLGVLSLPKEGKTEMGVDCFTLPSIPSYQGRGRIMKGSIMGCYPEIASVFTNALPTGFAVTSRRLRLSRRSFRLR